MKRERAGLGVDALAHRFPKVVAWEHGTDFYFNNGHYGTREDVVFLINGIPVLVIECKNATKEEAIGIDQIAVTTLRRRGDHDLDVTPIIKLG